MGSRRCGGVGGLGGSALGIGGNPPRTTMSFGNLGRLCQCRSSPFHSNQKLVPVLSCMRSGTGGGAKSISTNQYLGVLANPNSNRVVAIQVPTAWIERCIPSGRTPRSGLPASVLYNTIVGSTWSLAGWRITELFGGDQLTPRQDPVAVARMLNTVRGWSGIGGGSVAGVIF